MTHMLFRDDAYLRDAGARVIAHTPEGGVVLDATVFYPTGGGQPGDSGVLEWLHLLSVVVPFGVTGGAISANHGRLDFNMPEAPEDRDAIETTLNAYVMEDAQISESWMTAAELDENPGLVKTMAVKPPRGAGQVRLVRIGDADAPIDLQPCGGTHVARTGEIGQLRLGKIEKKGRMNRRVYIHLDN